MHLSPSALLLVVLAISCGPRAVSLPAPSPAIDSCALSRDTAPVPERLFIALAGSVDPAHAPVPTTDAERFVFPQLFETLVRIDCTGTLRPVLAESWRGEDDGRQWTFTVRPNLRFSDGTAVTGQAIVDSWTGRGAPLPSGSELTAASEREVLVRFPSSLTDPRLFADPAFAVTRRVAGKEWPSGTGPYAADTTGGTVTMAPFGGTGRPVLVVRPSAGSDARDLVDKGIDLFVTDDAAVLSYAAGRPDYTTVALPWGKTYVLAVPIGAAPIDASVRAGLARDAVRVEARAAAAAWWSDPGRSSCGITTPPPAPPAPALTLKALVYRFDDATARDLAGRLVALRLLGFGDPRASGLGVAEFSATLASGGATAYLLALPSQTLDACRALRELVARAPWLADDPARHLAPLVDVRRRAIVRRGAAAFTVEWDGTLRVR
jgi:hypothetical protein